MEGDDRVSDRRRVTVDERGTICLPEDFRERLGIREGDRVFLSWNGREASLRRIRPAENEPVILDSREDYAIIPLADSTRHRRVLTTRLGTEGGEKC